MKMKKINFLIIAVGVIIILLLSGLWVAYYYYSVKEPPVLINNYCDNESRLGDFCVELYKPVCGWSDPEKIQCIKYPCAQTYSNSCFACHNLDVSYWTDGECPK
ncbi:MAG: hypothetical protein AABW73_03280 [Nanoarchaeota archaeon]